MSGRSALTARQVGKVTAGELLPGVLLAVAAVVAVDSSLRRRERLADVLRVGQPTG